MRILISNDDGIEAPGLAALHEVACEFGEVTVAAPDGERSAAGHAITLGVPIRTRKVNRGGKFFGTAVNGAPADCVKLAINALMDSPPDLVISGINLGSNTGTSTVYSGTVAAAREGAIHHIPSIAVSSCSYLTPHFETAQQVLRDVLKKLLVRPLAEDLLLNINVPGVPAAELKGIRAAAIGKSRWIEKFHARVDPFGNDYYWLDGDQEVLDEGDHMDIHLVNKGYASVTPVQMRLTDEPALEELKILFN